jgi:hypothetical protein
MKYKVYSKSKGEYEDERCKLYRYSLVVVNGGLQYVDCTPNQYAFARVGEFVELPVLPLGEHSVDLTDNQIPDIL